jgi:hypothetical protein
MRPVRQLLHSKRHALTLMAALGRGSLATTTAAGCAPAPSPLLCPHGIFWFFFLSKIHQRTNHCFLVLIGATANVVFVLPPFLYFVFLAEHSDLILCVRVVMYVSFSSSSTFFFVVFTGSRDVFNVTASLWQAATPAPPSTAREVKRQRPRRRTADGEISSTQMRNFLKSPSIMA